MNNRKYSTEVLVDFCLTAHCHIAEDNTLSSHNCKNVKSSLFQYKNIPAKLCDVSDAHNDPMHIFIYIWSFLCPK